MKAHDRGKDADNKLPTVPLLTKEQLAKNDEIQVSLAKPVEASGTFYKRALAVIAETEVIPLKDLVPIQRENYAEALATVGKFKEAAKITRNPERKKYYKDIDKAVWLDDDTRCKCENMKTFDADKKPVEFSKHFVVREIFSEKHGGRVPLKRCNRCGFLNARE